MSALLEAVARWASERPSASALVTGSRNVTYAELVVLAGRRRVELSRLGHERGTRLAVVVTDALETLATVLGACELEATVLLVSAASPELERARLLEQFGGEAVVTLDGCAPVASPLRPDGSVLHPEPALALATSGVTGRPKVAERAWQAVVDSATALAQAIELDTGDVLLCTTPLHHAYSFVAGLVGCLLRGAAYVAPPTPTSPAALAELSKHHGVTVLFSVPVLYRWYLESAPLARPPRLAVSAGERLPHELQLGWRESYARELCNHYGSTELGMLTFEPEGVSGSAGWPLAGVEINLHGCQGCASGEVIARASGPPPLLLDVEHGVRRDVRAPAAFPTGDIARRERDGRLYLEGRVQETIDLGGVKVLVAQVEDAIRAHTEVRDCAVVSAPDASGIPRMCAFVEAGGDFDARDLRSFMLTQTAAQKLPSAFHQLSQLPRTESGKVDRPALVAFARKSGRPT